MAKKKKTKFKIRKSVSRRIKVTSSGKLFRGRSFSRHLKAGKRKNRIRRSKGRVKIEGSLAKKLKKALGLGYKK